MLILRGKKFKEKFSNQRRFRAAVQQAVTTCDVRR